MLRLKNSMNNHIAGLFENIYKKRVIGVIDFYFWHADIRLRTKKMETSFFGWTWFILAYITVYEI